MWKFTAGLLTIAVVLTLAIMVHGVGSGIVPPYPDPTPAQAAHSRYHEAVGAGLCIAAAIAWLVAIAVAAGTLIVSAWRIR